MDMRRKKKKKRKTISESAKWIKTEPDPELSRAQSENLDFWRLGDAQTQDAPKKKKKKYVKAEDLEVGASSLDFKISSDSNNVNNHRGGSIPQKKKKRKHKHILLGDKQSEKINKRAIDSPEESRNVEEGCPVSDQTEGRLHKCKKKEKRKVLGDLRLPCRTLVADGHESDALLSTVSDSPKKTNNATCTGHKKRKRKVMTGLHFSQASQKKTTSDEAKHKKLKKKAQKDGKYAPSNHRDSVPGNVEQTCNLRGKKRKEKLLIDNSQTSGDSESQISGNNFDVRERFSPDDTGKYNTRKKKKKKSTCLKEGSVEAITTKSSRMRTSRQAMVNDSPETSRHKRKQSDHSAPALSKISSPSENNPALEIGQRNPAEASSRTSKTSVANDGLLTTPEWYFCEQAFSSQMEDDEDDEETWIKDLPFLFEKCTFQSFRNATPKEGVVMKKGKWSGLEDRILKENVNSFCKQYNIDDVKKVILPLLFDERIEVGNFLREKKFFIRICRGLKRLPFDVYLRSRKICDDRNYKGKFTKEERSEVMRLKILHGNKWSRIGKQIDRSGQSVIDWYKGRPLKGRRHGKWREDEKRQLTRAVMAVTEKDEVDVMEQLVGIPWRDVYRMVPTRNKAQCMTQWKNTLCWSVGNRAKRDWTPEDSVDLIESVYALDVNEESEIDWANMLKKFWERAPSPCKLALKWLTLKLRYLKNYHFMMFEEILDELYHRVLPILKERIQKKEALRSRIKSKEFISDTDEDSGSDNEWY